MKILLSDLRMLLVEYDFSRLELEEFIDYVDENEANFVLGNLRFIQEDKIDEIMQREIGGDEYTLGCFNAWFIADVLNIDCDVIEEMQKAEAYTAIGKLILSMNKLEELQEKYASADGYGHHFNSWDGTEDNMIFNSPEVPDYYIFREN